MSASISSVLVVSPLRASVSGAALKRQSRGRVKRVDQSQRIIHGEERPARKQKGFARGLPREKLLREAHREFPGELLPHGDLRADHARGAAVCAAISQWPTRPP